MRALAYNRLHRVNMKSENRDKPYISVIIPVYNAERFLEETVRSVLRQTFTDWELILVDDGSSDRSPELCDRLATEDGRIHVFHKQNGGVSSARNYGLSKASGEWIEFMDSDDTIDSVMMETLIRYSKDADRVVCGYRFVRDGELLGEKRVKTEQTLVSGTDEFRKNFNPIWKYALSVVWNGMYRKESINLLFREDILHDEDVMFNMNYMQGRNRFSLVPEILYNYRTEAEQSLTKKLWLDKVESAQDCSRIMREILGDCFSDYPEMIHSIVIYKIVKWMQILCESDGLNERYKLLTLQLVMQNNLFSEDFPDEAFDDDEKAIWGFSRKGDAESVLAYYRMTNSD